MLWQDFQYSLRMLLKNRNFTIVAIITLALGIGINTAVFSIVNGILIRPLPYQAPDELVLLQQHNPAAKNGDQTTPVSLPNFADWRSHNQSFVNIVGKMPTEATIIDGDRSENISGAAVSAQFFEMLGVAPQLGRWFLDGEDRPDANNVVVISHGWWQRHFGSDANIIGKTIQLDKGSYTVIGVTPKSFHPPDAIFYGKTPDIWLPLEAVITPDKALWKDRKLTVMPVRGRLRPGVTITQASAELNAITGQLDENLTVKLTPLKDYTVKNARAALLTFFGAVALMLLIVCVNIANMMLAKTAEREKEIAIRVALGASRWDIVRQLLTESMVLSILGSILGLIVANWSIDILISATPDYIPRLNEIEIDKQVLGVTSLVSIITGILFGIIPAFQASNPDINSALKATAGTGSAGSHSRRLRSMLIVAEVALSFALLAGAGFMVKSMVSMMLTDPGFQTEKVLTMQLPLAPKYADPQLQSVYLRELLEKVETIPGVTSAGLADALPLTINTIGVSIDVAGQPAVSFDQKPFSLANKVSPNYFRTMGIPFVSGRDFTLADWQAAESSVVINKTMANRLWPGQNPVGQQIRIAHPDAALSGRWMTVIGVVEDIKQFDLRATTKQGIYLLTANNFFASSAYHLTVRTAADPISLVSAIEQSIWSVNKGQVITNIETMNQIFYKSIYNPHFYNLLFVIFALAAMIVAAAGIYGIVSYSVAQRTQELGIRLALGATPRDLLRLVLGKSMLMVFIGIGCGLTLSVALIDLLKNSWFENVFKQGSDDKLTFIIVTILFACVGLLASYLPARKVTKLDPVIALRYN